VTNSTHASAEAILDLSVSVIELYFRIEAATQAIAGFAQAGGEWGVLRELQRDGPRSVPEMARARPISRQHCQTIVNQLKAQGLVEPIDNPRHKRSPLLRITSAGDARVANLTEQFLAASATFAPRFSAEEVAACDRTLRRAYELLAPT
jgi:DNA-binding MarR family transcriptional regulator